MWNSKAPTASVGKSVTSIPEWSHDATIYEVNVRQYTKEGTLKAFQTHLPRLKELGVKVLWLMPIHPISEKNRNGSLGSPYAVANYTEVNPDLGTMEDFKNLVSEAHKLGFKVLLDWVANHTGWDNPWIAEHPEWFTQDSEGNVIHPAGTNWTDVADLNYENMELQAAMLDALKFWVEETDIDGYRADHAKGVPVDFWNKAGTALNKIKPIYMLAEDEEHPELLNQAFNSNYSWRLHHLMNDIAQGKTNAANIKNYLEALNTIYPEGAYPMLFITNHDENSWAGTEYERLGEAVKTMAVLTFTSPGMPLVYSGQEAGLDRRLSFFDKDEISWDDLSMQDFYKRLVSFKKENPALWNGNAGGSINFLSATDENILVFVREKDANKVLVVMNLSANSVTAEVVFDDLSGSYQTLFVYEETKLGKNQSFDLKPWEYHIFYNK
jgi:glycosidase